MSAICPESGRAGSADPLWVFALVLLATAWALGDVPLSRTEAHRSITAHQMVESGQWLVPRLYGMVYMRKPPLYYWVVAATETLCGRGNEWVWRLPSAVGTALLAGFLCATAARWFSRPAGWVAGLSLLALPALWAQNRGADIDGLNNVASTMAAVGIIELLWASPRRPLRWMLFTGLAWGAMLLLKGPSGATIVFGAMLGPCVLLRHWRKLLRPSLWLALLLGTALFAAWAIPAWRAVAAMNLPPMPSGVRELGQILSPSWPTRLRALALPVELLIYALPASAALLFAFDPTMRRRADERSRTLLLAAAGAVLAGLVLGALLGVHSPRYLYVCVPMLALVAGGVAHAWLQGWYAPTSVRHLRIAIIIFTILFGALALLLVGMMMRHGAPIRSAAALPRSGGAALVWGLIAIIAGCAAIVGLIRSLRSSSGGRPGTAVALVALVIATAILFGLHKNEDRRLRSGYAAGQLIRQSVGDAPVMTGGLIFAQPDILFYARVPVAPQRVRLEELLTPDVPPTVSGWVALSGDEWALWKDSPRLSRALALPSGIGAHHLAWYEAP
ncbi:MAG: phospholipid carrier-dependent glycosyltransferase [Phycisphaeraceae bacterium]